MPHRTYYSAVFGELEQAFNTDDPLRAMRCFALPAVIRSKDGVRVFDKPVDLAIFFRKRMELNRSRGVKRYAFDLGEMVAAGPVGMAEVIWHRMGQNNASFPNSRLWYIMVKTAHGWRIEGMCDYDRNAIVNNRQTRAVTGM
ncbi:MAG: hypothetical protein H6891_01055 [Brucellaceae bacterium]|nr:hypothetical protein [Brucellaceae bacterium]